VPITKWPQQAVRKARQAVADPYAKKGQQDGKDRNAGKYQKVALPVMEIV